MDLSILLPAYNNSCLPLVKQLRKQCEGIVNLSYEIIVADDGSTNMDSKRENREINAMDSCRYVERGSNTGRAAIRNYLFSVSRGDYLLYLDSDVNVLHDDFVVNYIEKAKQADVVCGGVHFEANSAYVGTLRYAYEMTERNKHSTSERRKRPYKSFRSTNFLVTRKTMGEIGFDESYNIYGYEDVEFGRQLEQRQAHILHIDNEVGISEYDDNTQYLKKVEDSLVMLAAHRKELTPYSSLARLAAKLHKAGLTSPIKWIFASISKCLKLYLQGNHASLKALGLYRLGFYISRVYIMMLIVCSASQADAQNSTFNPSLQELGDKLLVGKQGSIVAIEPSTGEVKCMVSSSLTPDSINRAISVAYSPGSTFKTAQALAMITEGVLKESSSYPCSEGFWHEGVHIGCHKHRSPLKLKNAIAESCNSFFCKAFMQMIDNRQFYKSSKQAIDVWHKYMASMGLGSPLGIDMAGEVSGVMPDSHYLDSLHTRWKSQTIMWIGMGQGEVTVTPLQLCNLAASIANEGYYIAPHIHHASPDNPQDAKYTKKHYTLAGYMAYNLVIEGMQGVITRGTAKAQASKQYEWCGKTGTAENAEGDDHSIFIGFAPKDNPAIAIAVYVEHAGFGADVAAPIAAKIVEQYLTKPE